MVIRMSSLSVARHWHGLVVQMHGCTHVRMVIFGRAPRWVHAFINIVSHVVEWESSSLCICHVALLQFIVRMLLRVGLVHV